MADDIRQLDSNPIMADDIRQLNNNPIVADNARGGLFEIRWALAQLAEYPDKLEGARERFCRSPPPGSYRVPDNSIAETLDTIPSSAEDKRLQERKSLLERNRLEKEYIQIKLDRLASYPKAQFRVQRFEEKKAVIEGLISKTLDVEIGKTFCAIAKENVKARWVAQGIWNDNWDNMAAGVWKHQEPPSPEPLKPKPSPTEDTVNEVFWTEDSLKRSRNRNRNHKRAKVVRDPEREASRPLHQFLYQVAREEERLNDELETRNLLVAQYALDADDDFTGGLQKIGTRAYERVKNKWIKWGIWDNGWGVLPGMTWKHERPLADFLNRELIDFAKQYSLDGGTYPDSVPFRNRPADTGNRASITRKKHVRFVLPDEQDQAEEEAPKTSSTQALTDATSCPTRSVRTVQASSSDQASPDRRSNVLEEKFSPNLPLSHGVGRPAPKDQALDSQENLYYKSRPVFNELTFSHSSI
ncbi:hypothetical protein F4677DRAFT_449034 [Hypoxylon crocopeplum]|nr:hypothetical protein F4677DRAFT_449034 [Hypoxylon crocopeplum]